MYSREHAEDALEKLEQVLGVKIAGNKTIVDKDDNFLSCCPDGFIDDDKLVVIKSPYQCVKNCMEFLAKSDENFCLQIGEAGRLKLSSDHDYYYQVQGEMNICKRDICYFVVWSPTEFFYQLVERDTDFWDGIMLPRLLSFYRTSMLDDKWKTPSISEEEFKNECSGPENILQAQNLQSLKI